MRKLLPYEHQLIEALGVTKEEYLNFVVIQQDYKDPKVGTALDVRAQDPGTIALVLTIIGTLFQVGAALLAPKPEIPGVSRRNRQQRFAPNFGFNSTQELASYGDPVNLVYTNQNKKGSVRVAGSLVWSAIENFGSTQFMQLTVAIGASEIKEIDYIKTAFGQAALVDLDKQSVFIFAKSNGKDRIPSFNNIQSGFGTKKLYPASLKPVNEENPAFQVVTHEEKKKLGFSQAYTPSTSTSLGVFDVIPINVEVITRNQKGKEKEANIAIELKDIASTANSKWINRNGSFVAGDKIELFFNDADDKAKKDDKEPAESADNMRRQMVEGLDFGSTYMLGAAKFRLEQFVSDAKTIDEGEVRVRFVCIESGQIPGSPYERTTRKTEPEEGLKEQLENAQDILSDSRTIESEANQEVEEGARTDDFTVTGKNPIINLNFQGTKNVEWTTTFNAVIELDNGATETVPYLVVDRQGNPLKNTYSFPLGGSIAYTQEQKNQLIADKPKIKAARIRKSIRRQKKALKALIQDILAGVYNGENLPQGNNGYALTRTNQPGVIFHGRDPDEKEVDVYVLQATKSFLQNDAAIGANGGPVFHGYDKKIIDNNTSEFVRYTFIYVDRNQRWHFFPFNGIESQGSEQFFPNDPNLRDRKRPSLKDAKDKLSNLQAKRNELQKQTTKIKLDSVVNSNSTRNVLNQETQLALKRYDSDITAQEEKVEQRRQAIAERIDRNFAIMHKLAVDIIEDDIDYLEAIQDTIPLGDKVVTDQIGTDIVKTEIRSVIRSKEKALTDIENVLDDWDAYRETLDNNFFSRCLLKAESASYETLGSCNFVKFSLKTRLFRRISGRQKKYGNRDSVDDYSLSDNGVKSRMVFFRVFYKNVQTTTGGLTVNNVAGWTLIDYVFAIRRGSEADFYTQLGFFDPTQAKWQFRFEPIFDMQAEYFQRPFKKYAFLENTNKTRTAQVGSSVFFWQGRTVGVNTLAGYYPNEKERGPSRTNEWDMFSVNSDTQIEFSFESGPEITLTAVTEQQLDPTYSDKYKNMTMMSLGIFAGRGLESLRSLTALVTHGKLCRTVESPKKATASSSYAPDIFIDTLLDEKNGVGKYITLANIDTSSLQLAKNFCINNNLPSSNGATGNVQMFMDGIIADAGSWREFWINAAPFSLLELARKNGKDTLVPALPVDDQGRASDSQGLPVNVNVAALFTAGNILQGSYKEEFLNYDTSTEDLIASVVYRDFAENELFNQKRSVNVKLKSVGDEAVRETFDLSQFVTEREQAIMFGKLLCNQRRHVRKGIEFKTLPFEAALEPGTFIYVDVGLKNWDHYSSGVVMAGGALNSPLAGNSKSKQNVGQNTFNFLLYKPSTGQTESKTVSVTTTNKGISTAPDLNGYEGWMFVMGSEKPNKRVFRVTELALEEGGELNVKAVDYPCFEEANGTRAEIADFRSNKFDVS